MFYGLSFLVVWLHSFLVGASLTEVNSQKGTTEDLINDTIKQRCNRTVLDLPFEGIGGLFNITRSSFEEIEAQNDRPKNELKDLWVGEEITSNRWTFNKPCSATTGLLESRSQEFCAVKIWHCTREFRDNTYHIGSVWSFWSNVTVNIEELTAELQRWYETHVYNEMTDQEILLSAYGDSAIPALITSNWLISQEKGKYIKMVLFKPLTNLPLNLKENLAMIPRQKILSFVQANFISNVSKESGLGIIIAGSFKNGRELAKLYEVARDRIIPTLDMPERAGNDVYYVRGGIGGTVVLVGGITAAVLLCVVS